ncbi:PIG-L family deacetylase [Streptomyces sp. NPDC048664]|uniref:PIG-L family deacetylase n=1 Tax=Streptomyces sp. NPDC048664 TaxID=3154505 RepID=UPI003447E5EB
MRLFNRLSAVSLPGRRPPTGVAPHVQICAHTDDDLYFMTPDLWEAVEAGTPQVSVYLTTGEADGVNLAMDDPARKDATPDFPGYTAARQHGIRAAYAFMVTGDRRAPWERSTTRIGDLTAEISTLEDGRITLIFLNLRTGRGAPEANLAALWRKSSARIATLRPTSSPLPAREDGQSLTRDAVIDVLAEVLRRHEPSVVRIMDPDPQWTAVDKASGGITYCDNPDHTATALFAMAALERHEKSGRRRPAAVESYVGYCNKLRPRTLSPQQAARKFSYLTVYGGEDGHDCEQPPGLCGDRPLGDRAYNRFYGQSTNYRWQTSTSWLQQLADGRLAAFTVLGGRPVVWTQDRPGGDSWSGPAPLGRVPDGDGRFLPRLDVTRDADGRIHVLGMRAAVGPSPEHQQRDLMHLTQDGASGPFGTWTDLRSPYAASAPHEARRRSLGMPVLTASGKGVHLALRNYGSGLSGRLFTDGEWGPWSDLKGGVLEGLSALTRRDGSVELYATSSNRDMGMLRWHQSAPGVDFVRDYGTQLPAPAAPATLVEQPDGRLLMFSRQPGTGWLVAHHQDRPDGAWTTQPDLVATTPGFGPLAHTVLPSGQVALVQRTDEGGLSLCVQPLDGTPVHTRWTPLGGGPFVHTPATALDAHGRLVVAHIDPQTCLRTLTLDPSDAHGEPAVPGWVTHHVPECRPTA